jgi:hypothetical protein
MTDLVANVEARLKAAVDTVRALSQDALELVAEGGSVFPECVLISWEGFLQDQTARRIPPTPEAVDDMRVVMAWLGLLEPEEAELVWLRAAGHPWRVVSQRTGCVRPKAWSRWKAAIAKITRRGKGARAKASPPAPKVTAKAKAADAKGEDKDDDTRLPLFVPVDASGAGQGATVGRLA